MAFNGDHIQSQQLQQQQQGPLIDAAEQVTALHTSAAVKLGARCGTEAGVSQTLAPVGGTFGAIVAGLANQGHAMDTLSSERACSMCFCFRQAPYASACLQLKVPAQHYKPTKQQTGFSCDAEHQAGELPAGVMRETEKRRQLISAPTVPMQQPQQVQGFVLSSRHQKRACSEMAVASTRGS